MRLAVHYTRVFRQMRYNGRMNPTKAVDPVLISDRSCDLCNSRRRVGPYRGPMSIVQALLTVVCPPT